MILRWFGSNAVEDFGLVDAVKISLYEIRDNNGHCCGGTSDKESAVKMLQRFANKYQGHGFYIHECGKHG